MYRYIKSKIGIFRYLFRAVDNYSFSERERKKERKKEKRRKERKQFNPEKYNPVCKPIDAKLGLAYVCHGSSREYFWGKLHAEYYK